MHAEKAGRLTNDLEEFDGSFGDKVVKLKALMLDSDVALGLLAFVDLACDVRIEVASDSFSESESVLSNNAMQTFFSFRYQRWFLNLLRVAADTSALIFL